MKLYPNVTLIFIIWLVAALIISYIGFTQIPNSGKFSTDFFKSLGNWDGGHFLSIAQFGYKEKIQYAFFPLYPMLIKAVNQFTQDFLIAGILISTTATFFGIHLLYRLVSYDFDKKIAQKAVLALLLFPTSFYFLVSYSEGLFFFLTVLTFYFLRQNKLLWACIAAALVSATRLVGLAVVAGLWVEVLTRQGFNRKNWYLVLAPLGFLIYCFFLYKQTGDPFYFITAESNWQRTLAVPGAGFWQTFKNMPAGILDLGFAIFGLGFVIRAFRFLPASFSVFSLLAVSIPLLTPTLSSIPRFLLPVFPIFIVMALVKNYYINLILQILSISLLAIFTTLFISGYWVS